MIKGETVKLIVKNQSGADAFGAPIFTIEEEMVEDVIIGNPSTDAIVNDMQMYGKKLVFVLGIPKGDAHDWQNTEVEIRGKRFRTYGFPLTQTSANVPGKWNTQVKVEEYGG